VCRGRTTLRRWALQGLAGGLPYQMQQAGPAAPSPRAPGVAGRGHPGMQQRPYGQRLPQMQAYSGGLPGEGPPVAYHTGGQAWARMACKRTGLG